MRERRFVLRRTFADNGKVSLPHALVLGEHLAQARQGLARLGKEHDAADGAVQPVHHTQIDVTGLLIPLLQVGFHHIGQGDIAGLVALHNVPYLLRDCYQVIILVENSLIVHSYESIVHSP